ncbi:hypothetical protein GCM10010301_70630 [Streptomyces plicatus]|nr:hypothetical protein GCM10010301_70630 [Streptomyces plicatus]
MLLHDAGRPLRAQGLQCRLGGVAMYAEAVGEGGGRVQELRDARGQLVAGDLVPGASGPAVPAVGAAACGV